MFILLNKVVEIHKKAKITHFVTVFPPRSPATVFFMNHAASMAIIFGVK